MTPDSVRPYRSALDHLHDWGVCVALLLRRFIVLHADRLIDRDGRLDDLHVSLNEALAFFGRRLRHLPVYEHSAARERSIDELDEHLLDAVAARQARERASASLPLVCLAERFGLEEAEIEAIAVLAVIESDFGLARVCRYAIADGRRHGIRVAFVHELIGQSGRSADAAWQLWSPIGRLRGDGLIEVEPDRGQLEPLLLRRVRLWPRLAAWIRGVVWSLDERLEGCARWAAPGARLADLVLADPTRRVLTATDGAGAKLALVGPPSIGKTAVARSIAARGGSRALIVDVRRLAESAHPHPVRGLMAEARLQAGVLLVDLTGLTSESEARIREALESEPRIALHPGVVVFATTRSLAWLGNLVPSLVEVPMGLPAVDQLEALWRTALDERDGTGGIAAQVAEAYRLPPGAIRRAAEQASLAGHTDQAQRLDRVHNAARRQLQHRLGTLADPVVTRLSLDQVVLSEESRRGVEEILEYARRQPVVLDEWGFGSQLTYGHGLSVLFSGPPGTGKTLVSGIIARELGRELFRVDISRVVDKFVGETEKNLARIFDEAERAQAVLLFDEADSLFAKRTSVESSHDRYANLEVNYLLQRMERFGGMSILTTNFETAIDQAFKRRLRFSMRFEQPTPEQRALLWEITVPQQARRRLADDVDWEQLARTFEFAGGYIKNAVLRAAVAAAGADGVLTQERFYEAGCKVYAELGRLAPRRRRRG